MKTYVFFTNGIGGYNGGPCYIRNKTSWLKSQGWNVIVFDSTSQFYRPIIFEELKCYSNNRIPELYFHPSWLSHNRREKVINRILNTIDSKTNCIIESNLEILAEWGEIIASRINAKHIVYLITENGSISDLYTYDFFLFKTKRNELFTINAKRFVTLFENFQKYNVEIGSQHVWQAMNASQIEDCPFEKIKTIPEADYYIGHFGRLKDYFPQVIDEINRFALKHSDKQICFSCLGIDPLPKNIKKLIRTKNILIRTFPSQSPIPKVFFKKFKVIIATAGCASMAYRNGNIVISMDVEANRPLGIMGVTTQSSTFRIQNDKDNRNICEILEDLLCRDYIQNIVINQPLKYEIDYNNHLNKIDIKDKKYYNNEKGPSYKGLKNHLIYFTLRIGMIKLLTIIRNYSFTRNVSNSIKNILNL